MAFAHPEHGSKWTVVPPMIEVAMSGADVAWIDGNRVKLRYTDGAEEMAVLTDEQMAKIADGDAWFYLVDCVQSCRLTHPAKQ